MHLVYSRKIVVFTLKVLTHRAMGDATLIRNVNKRRDNANFFAGKIFLYTALREANIRIKLAKKIMFGVLSFALKEKQWSRVHP